MPRRFLSELAERETISEVFLLGDKQLRHNRNGNLYLQMRLSDKSASANAMLWNAKEDTGAEFSNGDYVHVDGTTQLFNGSLQLIVTKIRRVNPQEINEEDYVQMSRARKRTEVFIDKVEAGEQLQELQDELREARRSLARARQPLDVLEAVEEQVEMLQETVEAPVERRQAEIPGQPVRRAIRLGDKVRLRTLNTNGVVTSLGEDEAELQIGALRIRARLAEMQLAGEPEPAAGGRASLPDGQLPTARDLLVARKSRPEAILPESPGIELDLRGQRAEEALDALDRYLDAAYLAGLPWVRIIHGKGTGKLRLSVREALSNHPHIKSFESGGEKEGGDGVTVAKLAV